MSTRRSTPAEPEPGPADVHVGLSNEEVDARRKQYGPNEVLEKKRHAVLTILAKFWGLSAWMLEAIAALSWTLHRYADLAIATSLLALNAVIAVVQERREIDKMIGWGARVTDEDRVRFLDYLSGNFSPRPR